MQVHESSHGGLDCSDGKAWGCTDPKETSGRWLRSQDWMFAMTYRCTVITTMQGSGFVLQGKLADWLAAGRCWRATM